MRVVGLAVYVRNSFSCVTDTDGQYYERVYIVHELLLQWYLQAILVTAQLLAGSEYISNQIKGGESVKKILVMGLPGAGKTTLALALREPLKAVHFNADLVRRYLHKDLGFSLMDRIEQARRMSFLCDTVVTAGHFAIADFVCPTAQTREAFGPAFTIWVDRVDRSRFEDTNRLFEAPDAFDARLSAGSVEDWVNIVLHQLHHYQSSAEASS